MRFLRLRCAILLVGLFLFSISSQLYAVELVGYVPYYRLSSSYLNNVLPEQLTLLDEVRYFGLSVGNNGEIVSLSGSVASHKNNIATIKSIIAGLPEEDRPRLDITLGAAGQDATFTNVAASSNLRDILAGNVSDLLIETGATAVDIDWEHPDAGIQRSTHYPALLKRIKQEVGANIRVTATVAPSVVISNSVFSGPNAIDGASLMTYDLGWWSGDPANPNNGEHSLPEYAEDAVQAWTDAPGSPNQRPWVFGTWGNGSPADKLGVALPFYGRGLSSGTAFTYQQLAAGGSTTDGNYYNFQGQTVWIPGPDLVEDRIAFAEEQGLQNIIIWEMGHDLDSSNPNSLLRHAFDAREALAGVLGDYDGDGLVDTSDYNLWVTTFGSTSDLRADGNDNGVVDAADFTVWRDQETVSVSTSVPEPTSIVSLVLLIGWAGLLGRRSK